MPHFVKIIPPFFYIQHFSFLFILAGYIHMYFFYLLLLVSLNIKTFSLKLAFFSGSTEFIRNRKYFSLSLMEYKMKSKRQLKCLKVNGVKPAVELILTIVNNILDNNRLTPVSDHGRCQQSHQ